MIKDFRVEAGSIMLFARALGDQNPIYSDEKYAENSEVGSIIAPPTFVQSGVQYNPDWILRPKIGEPWLGSGKEATGIDFENDSMGDLITKGLHAEQHYEYFKNITPGDILNVKEYVGREWEKEGKRGGKLKFKEDVTEYYNQDGDLMVIARYVSVITERVAT